LCGLGLDLGTYDLETYGLRPDLWPWPSLGLEGPGFGLALRAALTIFGVSRKLKKLIIVIIIIN